VTRSPEGPPEALRTRLEARGQSHVLVHWATLDAEGRSRLVRELEALDLELVTRLGAELREGSGGGVAAATRFEPPEVFGLARRDSAEAREAEARGAAVLAAGQVGFMLVAGGQGSRLGFEGPKGCFPIGPLTESPLFAWHAARILAAGRRHGFAPTWYVMTSPANDRPTREFFAEHDHFGLDPDAVFFFSQAMLPALSADGRIVLETPDRPFLAPNGHGGSLAALASSGALRHMEERGIEFLSYFQVDNPLARPADPLFLGLHAAAGAGMSSKVVAKRDAAEKVGVIGRADGKLGCIEYSDLPAELRDARDTEGRLVFDAGNIAAHVLTRGFVARLNTGGSLQLPWHLARKELTSVDDQGRPAKVHGVKFETFVFDALGETASSVTLEVDRHLEFSPVKNASGQDSPESCRADLVRHFAELAHAAGRPAPPRDATGLPRSEIDTRPAETAAELAARGEAPRELAGGHHYA
jgi:UDP-N-acetylglucosamine/UDP-N-acetylgalactosamine diphosphorylase